MSTSIGAITIIADPKRFDLLQCRMCGKRTSSVTLLTIGEEMLHLCNKCLPDYVHIPDFDVITGHPLPVTGEGP
jgi:hypothetical protein